MTAGRGVFDSMSTLKTLGSVALVFGLLGCAGAAAPTTGGAPVDVTGTWQLAAGQIDGIAIALVPDSPITMTVDGSKVSGRAACNFYGAEITVQDGAIRMRATSMTEMACQEPAMAAEAVFIAALDRIAAASRDGDRLALSGSGVRLEFNRLPPPPVANMVGMDWVLESLVKGDAVSNVAGAPAKLRFEPGGTFSGSTGCRTFHGKWVAADGGIATPEWGADGGDCPANLATQDSHVVGVIEGFRASVDGRTLTLRASGGDGLIYRAAE
jgi:heat shock protein HslJ